MRQKSIMGEKEIRQTIVFYHTWLDSIFASMDDAEAVQTIKMLQDYQRYALIPENTTKMQELVFGMARSTIDQNEKKFLASKKGGRPKKNATEKNEVQSKNDESDDFPF